jgi:hypothetical protein
VEKANLGMSAEEESPDDVTSGGLDNLDSTALANDVLAGPPGRRLLKHLLQGKGSAAAMWIIIFILAYPALFLSAALSSPPAFAIAAVAAHLAELRRRIGRKPIVEVPHLQDDVHDLDGLRRMDEFLFGA